MIGLNLLPSAQKKELNARMLYAMIERLMLTLTLGALAFGLLLVLVNVRLTRNLAGIKARQILTSEYAAVNESVKTLDQQIARIAALQHLGISPSALLRDLAERTPPGIAVASLGFDTATGRLDLTGIAAKREDVLAYEEALKRSPFVTALESPIANLFRKTDANFRFMIAVNVEALRNAYPPAL